MTDILLHPLTIWVGGAIVTLLWIAYFHEVTDDLEACIAFSIFWFVSIPVLLAWRWLCWVETKGRIRRKRNHQKHLEAEALRKEFEQRVREEIGQ